MKRGKSLGRVEGPLGTRAAVKCAHFLKGSGGNRRFGESRGFAQSPRHLPASSGTTVEAL